MTPSDSRFRPATGADTLGVRVPDRAAELLRDLVHAETGMYYDVTRLPFLVDRLSARAIERGFDSLLDYYYLLKYDSNAAAEWARAIDALSVQETYFWREADQFTALANSIMPVLVASHKRPIRIWSFPCATGEEPLSIAMALSEAGWWERAEIELVASDASEAALARASRQRYGGRAFRQLSEAMQRRYFEPLDGGLWQPKAALSARIKQWTRVNAVKNHEVAAHAGADVIFCRNMFIYFDQQTIQRVVSQFAAHMPMPGFLCIGSAESLLRLTSMFELRDYGGAFVYARV